MNRIAAIGLFVVVASTAAACSYASTPTPLPTETDTTLLTETPLQASSEPTALPVEATSGVVGPIVITAVQSGTGAPGSGPQVIPVDTVTPGPTNTPIPIPQGSGGIVGQALLGPICPVQREDDPCPDQPYPTTITVQDAGGTVVGTVNTDAQGVFRIDLPAGTYTLIPQNPADSPFPVAGPQQVSVPDGQYTSVIVSYDTGIR